MLYEYLQSGFRSKHAVSTSLAHLFNQILKGFESGKSTGMILINLQKAFDSLDHDMLLDKMKYLGFTSKTIDWFGSYLKKWNIVVNLGKTLSENGILRSTLRPVLFLLHVKYIKATLRNCDFRLYGDDTCILYSHQNVKFIERNLNYDFSNLCERFIGNIYILEKIKLAKSILFKRGNKSNLSLNITRNISGEAMARMVLKKV